MNEIENILKETLLRVIKFRSDYTSNEQAVRTQLIEPILNTLGWNTSNPEYVRPNAPHEDGKIPDYTLLKNNSRTLIVEAKNLSVDLLNYKTIEQLADYCYHAGINFGVLTNGSKWLLFKTFEENPKDRIVWQVDLEKDNIDYVSSRLSLFSYSEIETLKTLLNTRKILDDNWKELIESTDTIVTIISKKLLDKIKSTVPAFKIDQKHLKTFTKSKMMEIIKLGEIKDEEKEENISPVKKESGIEEIADDIFRREPQSKIREKISVTFPDNTVIRHNKVVDTFDEVIKRIGPESIKPLNIYRSGVALVSEIKDKKYNQHKISKYWIMTNTSTKEKVAVLNEINEKLDLKLKIEIFVNEG